MEAFSVYFEGIKYLLRSKGEIMEISGLQIFHIFFTPGYICFDWVVEVTLYFFCIFFYLGYSFHSFMQA